MNTSAKLASALLAACVATAAHAEQAAIAVTGQVKSVTGNSGLINASVHVGDTVTGYYVFDTATPDGNASPLQGVYPHSAPEHGMVVEIGGLQFASDPAAVDFTIALDNDLWGPGRGDTARLVSKRNLFSPGVPAASTDMTISLYQRASTALASDALSVDALLAPQWYTPTSSPFAQSATVSLYGSDASGKFMIEVKIAGAEQIELP